MEWFVKALNKDERGFTLIELIVVIAILGILAAIAVPNVTGVLSKSKAEADKSNAAILAEAAQRYYIEQTSNSSSNPPTSVTTQQLKDGGYINNVPKDQYGGDFQITFGTNGSVTVKNSQNQTLYPQQ